MEMLREHEEKSPYYCHYMSWRLGTWEDELFFFAFRNIALLRRKTLQLEE